MVLDMSLRYWLYLQKPTTVFSHITDISCQLNVLSDKANLMDVAVLILKLCSLEKEFSFFLGHPVLYGWVNFTFPAADSYRLKKVLS